MEPTAFAGVDKSVIATEEIFGPVLAVIAAKDEDDAIALANDNPYGLNAEVLTNDTDRAYRVARILRTGTVGQNGPRTDFSIVFGGFKLSGVGLRGWFRWSAAISGDQDAGPRQSADRHVGIRELIPNFPEDASSTSVGGAFCRPAYIENPSARNI